MGFSVVRSAVILVTNFPESAPRARNNPSGGAGDLVPKVALDFRVKPLGCLRVAVAAGACQLRKRVCEPLSDTVGAPGTEDEPGVLVLEEGGLRHH